MTTSVSYPKIFSSVLRPVVFEVERDVSTPVSVWVGGHIKDMSGSTLQINVSDYYKDSISPAPESPESGQSITTYNGVSIKRAVLTSVEIDIALSPVYLVGSEVDIPQNKFLTGLRRRHYNAGCVDELSAASDGRGLGMAFLDSLADQPQDVYGLDVNSRYKTFVFNSNAIKRYAALVDSDGNILDYVEYIPAKQCAGARLAWINKYGAIDYWNYRTEQGFSSAADKSLIYSSAGYMATQVTAEDTITVDSGIQVREIIDELKRITTSPAAWLINNDNSRSEIDIITSDIEVYDISEPKSIEIQFRPRKRRL